MIVCICNNISEDDIKSYLEDGLTEENIVGPITSNVCGCCRHMVNEIIENYKSEN